MTSPTIPVLLAALLLAAPASAAPARPAVDSLLTRARAATAMGDIELALRLAQSAIVADPARPSSYVALGNIYAETGQADYARSYYESALEIEPTDAGALRAMAALDGKPPSATASK